MALSAFASPSIAQESANATEELGDISFDAYLQLLIARARAEGVSERTLNRMTSGPHGQQPRHSTRSRSTWQTNPPWLSGASALHQTRM